VADASRRVEGLRRVVAGGEREARAGVADLTVYAARIFALTEEGERYGSRQVRPLIERLY
jgi:hypothetical protein